MGQYYSPVSLDQKQYLYSHDYNSGLKLMEHSWLFNDFVNAVVQLLKPGGNWYQNRIVWAGDYGDEGKFLEDLEPKTFVADYNQEVYEYNLHTYADDYFEKIQPPSEYEPELRYIVNHSKNEYVDLQECPKPDDGWIVHPLPLLTSNGNGRGGGDYGNFHGDTGIEYVGTWAGDRISAEYEYPAGFKEITPDFQEHH